MQENHKKLQLYMVDRDTILVVVLRNFMVTANGSRFWVFGTRIKIKGPIPDKEFGKLSGKKTHRKTHK